MIEPLLLLEMSDTLSENSKLSEMIEPLLLLEMSDPEVQDLGELDRSSSCFRASSSLLKTSACRLASFTSVGARNSGILSRKNCADTDDNSGNQCRIGIFVE